MPSLTDAQIATLNAAMMSFVPIFYSGKGFERDAVKAIAWDSEITLTVENPWAGNTGYGSKSAIALDAEAAKSLGVWLLAAASRETGVAPGK
jgi:hypothetical protein